MFLVHGWLHNSQWIWPTAVMQQHRYRPKHEGISLALARLSPGGGEGGGDKEEIGANSNKRAVQKGLGIGAVCCSAIIVKKVERQPPSSILQVQLEAEDMAAGAKSFGSAPTAFSS